MEVNLPRTEHIQRAGPIRRYCVRRHEAGDDLVSPMSQPDFRQGVLTRNGLVVHTAEGENQRAEDTSPVFPSCAVEEQRRRRPLCDVA